MYKEEKIPLKLNIERDFLFSNVAKVIFFSTEQKFFRADDREEKR